MRIDDGPIYGPGCEGLCRHYEAPFPEVPDALAVGQFDGDAEGELVAGFPNDSPHNGGEVVLCFSPGCSSQETWSQDSPGIVGGSESGDRFGASLAVGDFNGDGNDDLAVGVTGENATYSKQGAFQLIYGDGSGLTATGNQLYGSAALQADAAYATSLAAGGFDNVDAADELAAGAPVQDYTLTGGPTVSNAGIVDVHFTGATNTIWDQGPSGLPGTAESFDHFGAALAVGDFNGDRADDLAIGVPQEDVGSAVDAGAVNIVYGTPLPCLSRVPYCGDDVVESGEECDGTDDSACPGHCLGDCTCGLLTCGNGIREGIEQCDGADDTACVGLCQSDCTCGFGEVDCASDADCPMYWTCTTTLAFQECLPVCEGFPGGTCPDPFVFYAAPIGPDVYVCVCVQPCDGTAPTCGGSCPGSLTCADTPGFCACE